MTRDHRNNIKFTITTKDGDLKEVIKFCEDGNIYIFGRLAENDKDVVEAVRKFLRKTGDLD